jgi:predicted dehydrogenase
LADFAAAIQTKKAPVAGPEMSLGELRTALAIYKSANNRQWAKVWDNLN